jgi:hypothetical protein
MLRGLLASLAVWLVGCGRQDGIVGVEHVAAGGVGSAPTFVEEFAENSGLWDESWVVPGASVSFGETDARARDGRLLSLVFPGHPEYDALDREGADQATQVGSRQLFHFGTYRTRVGFGACAPSEEAVMAFLGYFNDGEDHDGDGIVDDLEIDIQVACGTPRRMYLTVFTDAEPTLQGERFQKLGRVVDFATGDLFDTKSSESDSFVAAGNDPELLAHEVVAPAALYELGFEWHTDSIRFFLQLNGVERDLWRLNGAEHIPQRPVHIVYNLWHPDSHWYPDDASADYPRSDVVMLVDWVSFEPE